MYWWHGGLAFSVIQSDAVWWSQVEVKEKQMGPQWGLQKDAPNELNSGDRSALGHFWLLKLFLTIVSHSAKPEQDPLLQHSQTNTATGWFEPHLPWVSLLKWMGPRMICSHIAAFSNHPTFRSLLTKFHQLGLCFSGFQNNHLDRITATTFYRNKRNIYNQSA